MEMPFYCLLNSLVVYVYLSVVKQDEKVYPSPCIQNFCLKRTAEVDAFFLKRDTLPY